MYSRSVPAMCLGAGGGMDGGEQEARRPGLRVFCVSWIFKGHFTWIAVCGGWICKHYPLYNVRTGIHRRFIMLYGIPL